MTRELVLAVLRGQLTRAEAARQIGLPDADADVAFRAACDGLLAAKLPPASLTLAGYVSRPVRIVRDRTGTAHVYAETARDLFVGYGFALAQDRLWQLDYYRRFGHIYAVGIPTKKWRLVVVSDPGLLDEVAANEQQFGKPIEEINFFAQLQNTRGQGLSVIGDGEHRLNFKRRLYRQGVSYGADAFFFQEGDAARYSDAKYGVLHVDPDGNSVLVGLADANRKMLTRR